jgi:hypothetical protein
MESMGKGQHGLFAIEDIPAGSHLGVTSLDLNEEQRKLVQLECLRTPLGGFANHSEEPNAVLVREPAFYGPLLIMWSAKPIKVGEEITVFYMDGYEDIIDNFGGPKFWGRAYD